MTPFCQIISFSSCTLWGVKTELQGNEAVWEHKTNMQIKLVVFYVHVYIYIYYTCIYVCIWVPVCEKLVTIISSSLSGIFHLFFFS